MLDSLNFLYAIIIAFALFIWLRSRATHASSLVGYPTVVPVIVPWIGHSVQYARNPISFLNDCRLRYGPVYRILVGGMRITVVSSTDTLASVFRDQTKTLHAGEQNMHMFHAVAEIDINHTFVYEVTDKMLFPIIADCLSKSSLEIFTSDFARHLLQFLEPLSNSTGETTLPLSDLVGEAMYQAASLAIFGPLFPTDSHKDFALLDGNVHILLLRLPFTARPAVRARHRLLSQVLVYITNGWRTEGDGYIEGASELASGCVRVLKNTNLSDADIAAAFLSFMWGIHAMSVRSSFWVMAHLVTHDDAMKQIREEADEAIATTPGGLSAFLQLPNALDAERLPLLESAVKETVRLITVTGGLRKAISNVEIRGTDQTYVVPKGEYVLAYPRHQNYDENLFPDPNAYKFDRFAVEENKMNLNVTRMSWGGGIHLCKGRHFAQYTLKCVAVACLHLLDITPAVASTSTPKVSPRSVGVLRADEEWLVRIQRRRM